MYIVYITVEQNINNEYICEMRIKIGGIYETECKTRITSTYF